MGISERRYASDGGPGGLGSTRLVSFTTWLIGINAAVFVAGALAPRFGSLLNSYGNFSTGSLIQHLEFWRVITFQFLHANLLHMALNMFGLWVFGRMVEEYLGFKRYAALYLVCGIFGAVAYLILNGLGLLAAYFGMTEIPLLLYNSKSTPLVGASAGVFGVIMASAFIAPNAIIQLIFPPVTLKLRTVAYVYVGIAAFNLIVGGNNAGGDAAHLGGAAAGYFFIRNSHLLRDFFDVFTDSRKASAARKVESERGEIDRILSKVKDNGLQSLSESEKRALRRATERQRRAN
jgi:membrane associated rhomboid family serine protease